MTRKEKLQKAHQMFDNRNLLTELKWQREYFKKGYVSNQEELFNLWIFDECIKALEPTTKNDLGVDCISRADAIQAMQDKAKKLTNEDTINGLCGAVAILYELPPVTPQEPRKGHWIGIDEEPHEDWECDNCGFVIWADENIEKFHYCPNCGCRMVEPQESEDT